MAGAECRLPPFRTDPHSSASGLADMSSDLDEVIALFRKALPGCGLKLVVPPPFPNGNAGRLSLSVWRRGEPTARLYSAATARKAVAQLFDSEFQSSRERRLRDNCQACRGIGWYITTGGVRVICTHHRATSPPCVLKKVTRDARVSQQGGSVAPKEGYAVTGLDVPPKRRPGS